VTTREDEFGKKLKVYLDQGSGDLRSGIAYRLQQARAEALARATGRADTANVNVLQGAPGLAGVGGAEPSGGGERPLYAQPRVWLAIAVLVAAMIGYQQWTAWQDLQELEDLDAQILTSDLPIDAYLDRGFQLWLKTGKPDE
jgi:Protein of unknown function (DUF3619)